MKLKRFWPFDLLGGCGCCDSHHVEPELVPDEQDEINEDGEK